jgi:hypothetical protein
MQSSIPVIFSCRLLVSLSAAIWTAGSLSAAPPVVTPETVQALAAYQTGGADSQLVLWKKLVRELDAAGRREAETLIVSAGGKKSFTPAGRELAAEILGQIGGEASIPLLVAWAGRADQAASQAAIRALTVLPVSAASQALVKLLADAPDELKISVLDALADRREAGAVNTAAKLLRADDRVAAAVLSYLGTVGSAESVAIVSGFNPGDPLRDARAWALIAGGTAAGAETFKSLMESANSEPVRVAAARDLLSLDNGALAALLRDQDEKFRLALARTLVVSPATAVSDQLAQSFDVYPEDVQVVLLDNIANLRTDQFPALVRAGLTAKSARVQNAALSALSVSGGGAENFDLLAGALADRDEQRSRAALDALAALRGDGVTDGIARRAVGAGAAEQVKWLAVIARRANHAAFPLTVELAGASSATVRAAAFAALKNLAAAGDLPALTAMKPQTAEEQKNWGDALVRVARLRAGDAGAVKLLQPLTIGASAGEVAATAKALAVVGGPDAEAALNSAPLLGSPDAARRKDIIRAISGAPTRTALAVLENTAAAAGVDGAEKILALRGLLDTARQLDSPDGEKVAIYERAWSLADRDEEKKLVIAALREKQRQRRAVELLQKIGADN